MDLKTIRFLADYNSITNEKMNEHIKSLSEEQWIKKFGGYFNSIRSVCNHLCITDFNWLKRFSLLRSFDYIKDPFFKNTYSFGSYAITTKEEYYKLREDVDSFIKQFVKEIKEEDLNRRLIYRDSHNDEHDQEFGLVVLHVFNHQTHHRGMVSIYLEEMGIANDYSNIMDII